MKKPALESATAQAPALLVLAAESEARAAGAPPGIIAWRRTKLNERLDVVIAGVGKANAAAATTRALSTETSCVLSIGIAGALPGSGLRLGDVVLATASHYADEGIITPDGFQTCSEMGFPLAPAGADEPFPTLFASLVGLADRTGPIATVSTCSGADAAARGVVARTGALAEAMEGAAVVMTASRLGVPAAELRVISNTTGDRSAQHWDLALAFSRLAEVIGLL